MKSRRLLLLIPLLLAGGCYERVVGARGIGAGTVNVYDSSRGSLLQRKDINSQKRPTRPESMPPPMW
jgi:hypothetical protein